MSANFAAEYEPEPPRDTRPATLATLTIALGAERRRSGSSASVGRTGASKFTAMWRSMIAEPPAAQVARHAQPAAGEAPPPRRPRVVDQEVEAPVVLLHVGGDARRGLRIGEVRRDHVRA